MFPLLRRLTVPVSLLVLVSASAADDFRQGQPPQPQRAAELYVPDLAKLAQPRSSELRELVERFKSDRRRCCRSTRCRTRTCSCGRLKEFYQAWQAKLEAVPYEPLGVEGRIDWHLLRLHLRYELALVARDEQRNAEMASFLGCAEEIAALQEDRRQFAPVKPAAAAAALAQITQDIDAARKALEAGLGDKPPADALQPSKITAYRAANRLAELGKVLKNWFEFYDTYDPQFGWWTRAPYKKASAALDDYAKFLREKIVGAKPDEDEPIVGDPVGADGLVRDLEHDMMPYAPAQLIAVAEKEFAWCEAEWKKVAHDMGLGDDWKAALEQVKHDYVAPGEQPALIARQAYEASTSSPGATLSPVPPLAVDDWFMTMMSPERQKTAPFFLGGDQIIVSFPTDTMDQADKLDSLRANNRTSVTRRSSTNSSPATTCRAGTRTGSTSTATFSSRRSTSKAGRCGGSSTSGPRLPADARGSRRRVVLADPPLRADHFPRSTSTSANGRRSSASTSSSIKSATTGTRRPAKCGGRSTAIIRRSTRSVT
ncbi:MAG: DUF885 family protein [Lacunisphaera sp.]